MSPLGWATPCCRVSATVTQEAIAKELARTTANHALERSCGRCRGSASSEVRRKKTRCCFMRGQHSLRHRDGGTWMRYVLSHLIRRPRGLPTTLAIPVLAVGAVEASLRRLPVALARSTHHPTPARSRTRPRAVLLPAVAPRTDLGLRATNPADEHALARGRTLDRKRPTAGTPRDQVLSAVALTRAYAEAATGSWANRVAQLAGSSSSILLAGCVATRTSTSAR